MRKRCPQLPQNTNTRDVLGFSNRRGFQKQMLWGISHPLAGETQELVMSGHTMGILHRTMSLIFLNCISKEKDDAERQEWGREGERPPPWLCLFTGKRFFHYHFWTNCLTENKEKQTCDGFCWSGCFCTMRVGADRRSTREATNSLCVLSVAQERLPRLKSRLGLWGSPDPPGKYFLGSELGMEGSKTHNSPFEEFLVTRRGRHTNGSVQWYPTHFLPLSSEYLPCAGHCAAWWGFRLTISLDSTVENAVRTQRRFSIQTGDILKVMW